MSFRIKKAAVLGSGVMGSGIAAHLANAGIQTLLLDIVPKELTENEKTKGLTLESTAVRNRLADQSKQKLLKQKPAPLMTKENIQLIETGNMEDDMAKLSDIDWIIEVVVENLEIKKKVFAEIDEVRKSDSIISSNTSGISIEAMTEGRSDSFQTHFLGTHFFNPPRYLQLLEIIPTAKTSTEVLQFIKQFGEETLGKGIVFAKDTPNFIANRIGIYGLLVTVREMMSRGYSVGEVDSVTGPLIGRPKSATFRTLDVVGLDTFIHVANNISEKVSGNEKEIFDVPSFMLNMFDKGWIGSKSGQGFYLKNKTDKGKEILELNINTLEYEARKKLKAPSIQMSKQAKKVKEKIQTLTYAEDRAGELIWNIIKPVLLYSADLHKIIADDIVSIDQAMKWGFGWELGPFELWDAIGVKKSVSRMKEDGEDIPGWVLEMVESDTASFYQNETYYHEGEYKPIQQNPKNINISTLKSSQGVIKKNIGASLLDIGNDVALLEFHSMNQSIGLDVLQMINQSIDEVEKNYKGLVIGNQAKNFCVGANIGLILMEAQDDNYFEIDLVVRQFQKAMMRIKYSDKPVVAAPFGMTLGGGTEVCLPAAAIQASSETYMGLVEPGVGLIPGGGGNKELYIRQLEKLQDGINHDLQKTANYVFETIAMAAVSTSGAEAKQKGFLRNSDRITMNSNHLIYDAKQTVLSLYDKGYQPPTRKKIPVVGETGFATMLMGAQSMYYSNYISAHDLKIARKLAFVLAGGRLPFGTMVDEQYLLDIEREAFLSLAGEPKTQQRMQHMLLKGKPLRN